MTQPWEAPRIAAVLGQGLGQAAAGTKLLVTRATPSTASVIRFSLAVMTSVSTPETEQIPRSYSASNVASLKSLVLIVSYQAGFKQKYLIKEKLILFFLL